MFNFGFKGSGSIGQRPKRQYLNKATEFFFTELEKGMQSPFCAIGAACMVGFGAYRVNNNYIQPMRERAMERIPAARQPFADSHNAFWGLRQAVPGGHQPQTMTQTVETELTRPSLVHSEHSETTPHREWVVLELSEFDTKANDDVYFRSIHSIDMAPLPDDEKQRLKDNKGRKDMPKGGIVKEPLSPTQEHIHGMVKCRGIDSQNNCTPYIGSLVDEVSRKLMLALGPVNILRDLRGTLMTFRFTFVGEPDTNVLICGLRGGALARWLSTAFPNFKVDVVEPDAALARICRRYLGFREADGLQLHLTEPSDFLRRTAVQQEGKRYDLVVIDCVDGANKLSTTYSRLEFINNVRNCMTRAGMAVVNVPNKDPSYLYNVVQNWRIAFPQRTIVLIHCTTSDNTVMMAFQDMADRGKVNFGSVGSAREFKDLINTQYHAYKNNRIVFDLNEEINDENFRVFGPAQEYPLEHYLPVHHPALESNKKRVAEYVKQREESASLGSLFRGFTQKYTTGSTS